jgi:hypothetical protein
MQNYFEIFEMFVDVSVYSAAAHISLSFLHVGDSSRRYDSSSIPVNPKSPEGETEAFTALFSASIRRENRDIHSPRCRPLVLYQFLLSMRRHHSCGDAKGLPGPLAETRKDEGKSTEPRPSLVGSVLTLGYSDEK